MSTTSTLQIARPTPTLRSVIYMVLIGVTLFGAHFVPLGRSASVAAKSDQSIASAPSQLFVAYCGTCHTMGRSGMDFDVPYDDVAVQDERLTWERVLRKLRNHQMPPPDASVAQITNGDRARMMEWIEQALAAETPEESAQRRISARLLHRHEYQNAIRDLLQLSAELEDGFLTDNIGWRRTREMPTPPTEVLAKLRDSADAILARADIARMIAAENASQGFQQDPITVGPDQLRRILGNFARRAFRRPVTAAEMDALLATHAQAGHVGMNSADSIRAVLRDVLTSAHFVYRIETLPDPDRPDEIPTNARFELAARMSFFIWGSIPDDELYSLAVQGKLTEDLEYQVRRMLKDPKSRALGTGFTDYWLQLNFLGESFAIDAELIKAMREETHAFVAHIIKEDRGALELLDADYTFLNERLASHYGIKGIQGDEMRRVSTQGTQRGGLLSHASVLTVTSQVDHTSIVHRGKFVLDNILGTPPPPPPPGLFSTFKKTKANLVAGSTRSLLELHRSAASCAQCHGPMDSIGNSLENFDHTGAWRSMDGAFPIDASAEMPDGVTFNGPSELKTFLRGKHELFVRCLSGKLLGYSLGRKLKDRDRDAIESIPQNTVAGQYSLSSIVLEVVRCDSFQRGGR